MLSSFYKCTAFICLLSMSIIRSTIEILREAKSPNMLLFSSWLSSGDARNFHLGAISEGSGVAECGPGARPRQGVSETKSPEAEVVGRHCLDFDCRNEQNLTISHNSPPES